MPPRKKKAKCFIDEFLKRNDFSSSSSSCSAPSACDKLFDSAGITDTPDAKEEISRECAESNLPFVDSKSDIVPRDFGPQNCIAELSQRSVRRRVKTVKPDAKLRQKRRQVLKRVRKKRAADKELKAARSNFIQEKIDSIYIGSAYPNGICFLFGSKFEFVTLF